VAIEHFYSRPGHLIRRLNQISMGLFQEEAGSMDLTSVQYAALNIIREVPGVDQARLSSLIAFDRTTMVKVLDRLVDKGYITRTRSSEDRRTNFLNVTAEGAAALDRIYPMLDRSDRRILAPLSREEQRVFMALLSRLVRVNNAYSRAPLDEAVRDDLMARRRAAPRRRAGARP